VSEVKVIGTRFLMGGVWGRPTEFGLVFDLGQKFFGQPMKLGRYEENSAHPKHETSEFLNACDLDSGLFLLEQKTVLRMDTHATACPNDHPAWFALDDSWRDLYG
jgi:hypothetical protein